MLWLLALSLLGAATLGSVLAYQRGVADRLEGRPRLPELGPGPMGPVIERTLETLQVGDVVIWGDEDWLIVGTAAYQEEDERWWVHALEDGSRRRHLEVRNKEGQDWSASLLEPTDELPGFGQLGNGLTFRQQAYSLFRRGDAHVTIDGEHDVSPGLCRYTCYEGPAGTVLNVEEREGGRTAYAGSMLEASGLMLMPGEAPRPS